MTIAGEIELGDTFANQGAQLVRHVASATNDDRRRRHDDRDACSRRRSSAHGHQERRRRRRPDGAPARDRARRRAGRSRHLRDEQSREITTREQLARVATISAGDEEIGRVIADAIEQVGNDGALSVQDGQTIGHRAGADATACASSAAGSRRTWSPTRRARRRCSTTRSSCSPTRSSPRASGSGRSSTRSRRPAGRCSSIAEMIEGDALQTLVTNKLRGVLTSVAVVTPEFGERRKRVLEDLAVAHRRRAGDRGPRPDAGDDPARAARAGEARRRRPDDDDDRRRPGDPAAIEAADRAAPRRARDRAARRTSTRASSASGWRGSSAASR